jgi:hypothetical protein
MKRLILSVVAPLILAAGLATAPGAAYYDVNAMDYTLHAWFPNNPPKVISVAGLPTPAATDLEPMLDGVIGTDGTGQIDGVQYARVYFGDSGNQTNNYATFVINVTGTIRTGGTTPLVKMTLKGNGYNADAQSDYPNASLNLKFTSTNAPVTVYPYQVLVVTSAVYTVTYTNGTSTVLSNGPVTLINNNPYAMIGGTLTGTIKPGKKSSLNGGKPLKISEAGALFGESWIWTLVDATNVVQQVVGGSLVVNVLSSITTQVVQPTPGTKVYLTGGVGSTLDPYSGTGTVNNNQGSYKMKLKGVSAARGAVLEANGTLGTVIVGYQPTTNASFPTGYITNHLLNAIRQISFSGKAVGQKVPLTSGVNLNAPFPTGF